MQYLHCFSVYESGSVFSPNVLDITDDDLMKKFLQVNAKIYLLILTIYIINFLTESSALDKSQTSVMLVTSCPLCSLATR